MARRSRRSRDIPHELHRRVQQLERSPLHANSASGRSVRGLGLLALVDDPPVSGWGWYGEYSLTLPVDASWGWAGQVSAPRRIGDGWGWGDVVTPNVGTVSRAQAGWGWGDVVTAPPSTSAQAGAGWGWGDKVEGATQPPNVVSADADDLGL